MRDSPSFEFENMFLVLPTARENCDQNSKNCDKTEKRSQKAKKLQLDWVKVPRLKRNSKRRWEAGHNDAKFWSEVCPSDVVSFSSIRRAKMEAVLDVKRLFEVRLSELELLETKFNKALRTKFPKRGRPLSYLLLLLFFLFSKSVSPHPHCRRCLEFPWQLVWSTQSNLKSPLPPPSSFPIANPNS